MKHSLSSHIKFLSIYQNYKLSSLSNYTTKQKYSDTINYYDPYTKAYNIKDKRLLKLVKHIVDKIYMKCENVNYHIDEFNENEKIIVILSSIRYYAHLLFDSYYLSKSINSDIKLIKDKRLTLKLIISFCEIVSNYFDLKNIEPDTIKSYFVGTLWKCKYNDHPINFSWNPINWFSLPFMSILDYRKNNDFCLYMKKKYRSIWIKKERTSNQIINIKIRGPSSRLGVIYFDTDYDSFIGFTEREIEQFKKLGLENVYLIDLDKFNLLKSKNLKKTNSGITEKDFMDIYQLKRRVSTQIFSKEYKKSVSEKSEHEYKDLYSDNFDKFMFMIISILAIFSLVFIFFFIKLRN